MLKMTVRPLDIKTSNIPNRTPLSVDMTVNSSTTHRLTFEDAFRPEGFSGRTVYARERSVRPFHLAGGRKCGCGSIDLRNKLPAPAGLFLVERFLFGALAERGNIDRLEETGAVPAPTARAALSDHA